MIFNINAKLIYNPADGTLTTQGSDTPDTQLSLTTSALLFFILQHPEIITREEILKKIWDNNGLTSSNSNLNQYLSMIRKTFRYYGIDNIILTVSRGNLQLNPEITVDVLENNQEEPLFSPQKVKTQPERDKKSDRPSIQQYIPSPYWAGAILLGSSLMITVLTLATEKKLKPVALMPLVFGQCHLLANKEMLNSIQEKTYERNFNAVRQRLKINCLPAHRFAFFYGDKLQTNGLGRVYLAHCKMNEETPFGYCDNYFYYSWK